MFLQESNGVVNGHLTVGGVDTVELAKEYGTPLIALDEQLIRKNARNVQECY